MRSDSQDAVCSCLPQVQRGRAVMLLICTHACVAVKTLHGAAERPSKQREIQFKVGLLVSSSAICAELLTIIPRH